MCEVKFTGLDDESAVVQGVEIMSGLLQYCTPELRFGFVALLQYRIHLPLAYM